MLSATEITAIRSIVGETTAAATRAAAMQSNPQVCNLLIRLCGCIDELLADRTELVKMTQMLNTEAGKVER